MTKKSNFFHIIISLAILLIVIVGASLFIVFNNGDNNEDTQSVNNTTVSAQGDFSKQDSESSLPAQTDSSGFTSESSDDSTDQSSNSSEDQSSDISDDESTTTSDPDIHQHTFGNWKTLKTASCTEGGKKQRTCSTCGFEQNSTISALGHTYDSGTVLEEAKSCTDTGKVRYTCTTCSNQYIAASRGKHQFIRGGEYNITITCTLCNESFQDEFSDTINGFVPFDENSALVNDRIRLQQLNYNGKLSSWSEKWHKYRNIILQCMIYRSECYAVGAPLDLYPYTDYSITSEEDAKRVRDEFILFLDDFEDAFGWRPVEPTVGFYHDPWTDAHCLYFDVAKMYYAYQSQISRLTKNQIEQIEKDTVAYLIHSCDYIYDGMSLYNAAENIPAQLWRWAYYDWSFSLHNAIDGFALGSCVCDGYAKMYKRFAEYCNFDAEMVIGTINGNGHAWIKITFSDGTIRYIDPTHQTGLMRAENMHEYSW